MSGPRTDKIGLRQRAAVRTFGPRLPPIWTDIIRHFQGSCKHVRGRVKAVLAHCTDNVLFPSEQPGELPNNEQFWHDQQSWLATFPRYQYHHKSWTPSWRQSGMLSRPSQY
jgi:hypothetical protein